VGTGLCAHIVLRQVKLRTNSYASRQTI